MNNGYVISIILVALVAFAIKRPTKKKKVSHSRVDEYPHIDEHSHIDDCGAVFINEKAMEVKHG